MCGDGPGGHISVSGVLPHLQPRVVPYEGCGIAPCSSTAHGGCRVPRLHPPSQPGLHVVPHPPRVVCCISLPTQAVPLLLLLSGLSLSSSGLFPTATDSVGRNSPQAQTKSLLSPALPCPTPPGATLPHQSPLALTCGQVCKQQSGSLVLAGATLNILSLSPPSVLGIGECLSRVLGALKLMLWVFQCHVLPSFQCFLSDLLRERTEAGQRNHTLSSLLPRPQITLFLLPVSPAVGGAVRGVAGACGQAEQGDVVLLQAFPLHG